MWCTVLLGDHSEEVVSSSELENEMGDPISRKDLWLGTKVIWKYKNRTPYQVEILGTSSKLDPTVFNL